MSSEKMRAEFEAAYAEFSVRTKGFGDDQVKIALMRDDDDGYLYGAANEAWWAWQASRASLVADLPDDAAPASTVSEAMDLLDFGLRFALCNRDHAGTRRDVKKVQAQLRRLRELLAEQKPVGEVIHFKGGGGVLKFVRMDFDAFPEGTKLYVEPVTHPDARALVEALAEIAAMEPEPGEPESFMDDADFRYLKCLRKMQKIARAAIEAVGVRVK